MLLPQGSARGQGCGQWTASSPTAAPAQVPLPPDLVHPALPQHSLSDPFPHLDKQVCGCMCISYLHSSHTTAPPPAALPPTAQPTLWMSPIAAQLKNRTAQLTHPYTHTAHAHTSQTAATATAYLVRTREPSAPAHSGQLMCTVGAKA